MFASNNRRTIYKVAPTFYRKALACPSNINITRQQYRSYSSKPELNKVKSKWAPTFIKEKS
jgi:hypothetical protein